MVKDEIRTPTDIDLVNHVWKFTVLSLIRVLIKTKHF